MLTGQIEILQDPNSPQMKIWALLVVGTEARVMYGGVTGKGNRNMSSVAPSDGWNRLATKRSKYPLFWNEVISIDDQSFPTLDGAMDAIMRGVFNHFVVRGGNGIGIENLLRSWRALPLKPILSPLERSRVESALKSIPAEAPWAF